MEKASIDADFLKELDAYERKYFHPDPPAGWHKLLDVRGNKVEGGSFYCPRCKLHVFTPGATVKHCGRVESRPNWWKRLFGKRSTWQIRTPL